MANPVSSISVQKIVDRISDAFSVFDFSYIISGGCTFLLLYADLTLIHEFRLAIDNTFILILVGIFLSYICGLIVWPLGRFLRSLLCFCYVFPDKEEDFKEVYNQTTTELGTNFKLPDGLRNGSDKERVAFSYMWSWLQTKVGDVPELHEKIRLIDRYWVMQAVYEGMMGVSFIAIFILIDFYMYVNNDEVVNEIGFIFLIKIAFILDVFCLFVFAKEARSYARTQVRDLIVLYYLHSQS